MTAIKSCTIKLLNKNYEIKCPPQEENNLQEAAAKLNNQLQLNKKKFKHLDEFQILLLSAISITHEFVTFQKEHEQQRQEVTQFIQSLENKIQQAAQSHSQQGRQAQSNQDEGN